MSLLFVFCWLATVVQGQEQSLSSTLSSVQHRALMNVYEAIGAIMSILLGHSNVFFSLQFNDLSSIRHRFELHGASQLSPSDLSMRQLSGTIAADIGELSFLALLELSNNKIRGSLPSQLGQLANVRKLTVFDNRISGTLPRQLGNLSRLTVLSVAYNRFQGHVPVLPSSLREYCILQLNGDSNCFDCLQRQFCRCEVSDSEMCNSLSIVATMTIESQPPATFETEATRGSLAPPTFVTSTWNVKTTQETPITTTSTMTDTLASAGTTAITESFSSTSTAGESTTISVELASNGNALYIDDALIGGIVGGAVGLLCLVVGAIVLVVVVRRRRSKKSDNSNDDLDEKEIQGQSVDRMSAATSNFAVVPQFRATTSEYDVGDIQS